MIKRLACILAVLSVVTVFSCKPSVPSDYIQPGDMEDILYDYHIAMSMAEAGDEGGTSFETSVVKQRAYKLAVLKKHGVTERQFDNSLKYYMRHTERLHDMYEALSERLESESSAMGIGGDAGYRRILTANGDSADIWTGDRAVLLMADELYGKSSFAFKSDTAFHKGDRILLSFKTQYIVQEGSRDAVVLLCVKFANDSIASQYQRVSSNMRQTISIADTKRVGIKEVNGYMLFSRGLNNPSSTLKLLFITDIQLLRIHTKELEKDIGKVDSLKTDKISESPDKAIRKPLDASEELHETTDRSTKTQSDEPSVVQGIPDRKIIPRPDMSKRRLGNGGPPPPVNRLK